MEINTKYLPLYSIFDKELILNDNVNIDFILCETQDGFSILKNRFGKEGEYVRDINHKGAYLITEDNNSMQLIHMSTISDNTHLIEGQTILKVLKTNDYSEAKKMYFNFMKNKI